MQKRKIWFFSFIIFCSFVICVKTRAERLSSSQLVAVAEHMMAVCPVKEKQAEDEFRKKINQALPKQDYDFLHQTDKYKATRDFLAQEQKKANPDEVKRLCSTLEQWKKELPKNLIIKDDELVK